MKKRAGKKKEARGEAILRKKEWSQRQAEKKKKIEEESKEKEEEKGKEKGENEDKVIIFADSKLHCGEAGLRMKDYETETKTVKYIDIALRVNAREDIQRQLMKNGMGRVQAEKLAWSVEEMVYSGIGTTNRKYVDAISELTGQLKVNISTGQKLVIANVNEMAEEILRALLTNP